MLRMLCRAYVYFHLLIQPRIEDQAVGYPYTVWLHWMAWSALELTRYKTSERLTSGISKVPHVRIVEICNLPGLAAIENRLIDWGAYCLRHGDPSVCKPRFDVKICKTVCARAIYVVQDAGVKKICGVCREDGDVRAT